MVQKAVVLLASSPLAQRFAQVADDAVKFDFTKIAIALAAISVGGIGMVMAGYFLWPDQAQKYKKEILTVIVGLVLVALASGLVSVFAPAS